MESIFYGLQNLSVRDVEKQEELMTFLLLLDGINKDVQLDIQLR